MSMLGSRFALVLLTAVAFLVSSAPAQAAPQHSGARIAKAAKKKCAVKRSKKARKRCVRRIRLKTVKVGRVRPVKTSRAPAPAATPSPVAVASPAPTTAPSPAPVNSFSGQDMFGFAVGGSIQNLDAATLARDLDALQAAGSKWVRLDINWSSIQAGGPASYDWAPTDRVVDAVTARGMKVLGVFLYTPAWARPAGTNGTYAPQPATFAKFASEAATRYSALGVHHYEVWNEPNIPNFWTDPDVAAYTEMLKAAYPAIKAADPSATVLTAGTSPATTGTSSLAPVDFLKGIYANGGKGFFDAVAHHPYCYPAMPGEAHDWSAWHQMAGTATSLRSVMTANGDGAKKIWATEFGAPTNGPAASNAVTEATQAAMVTRAYSLWRGYEWAGPLMWYAGRDHGTDAADRENFFGLLRHDFTPKPSYAAYQAAASGS